jgi:putative ABC transport system permease protein
MIVNQAMAKQMFPNENPIGRRVRSWRDENVYREIVGVVADLRSSLSENFAHSVYVPHTQDSWRALMLTIRTDRDPNALLPSIRSAIAGEDAKLAISEVKTMEKILDEQLARPRFSMFLLGVFAATAILMAAVGIYGLIAYAVAQRTREIGIRMALGAVRFDILRSVTGRALSLTMAGITLGIVGALGVTRLMASLLYGVSPNDAPTLAGACLLLLFVALAASYIPARRASKVDPVVALRYE